VTHSLVFDDVYPYTGHSIDVRIHLVPPPAVGVPFLVNALIDTGAGITFLDNQLLLSLGIADVTTGVPLPITAADGGQGDGFIHDVTLDIWGRRVTIPAVFCPTWPPGTKNLLGMQGFLDKLLVGLAHRQNRLFYSFV
jgi:hypothetical protein